MKYLEVAATLVALGCNEHPRRGGGSHRKWFNSATHEAAVLPDWGDEDLNVEMVRSAVWQLGLDWQAFTAAFRSSTPGGVRPIPGSVSPRPRGVSLRRRGDLVVTRQVYQGQAWWVVKDPIALHYFRFRPEEYALLEMLDGTTSLDELKERFEARFPPQLITVEELSRFISTLHRSGLVIGDRPGQGPQLFERRRQRIWREWMAWLANIMSLRFRGIDPDRILERLDP